MSFTIFPGHNTFPGWDQWPTDSPGTNDKEDSTLLSTMENSKHFNYDKRNTSIYKVESNQRPALCTERIFNAKPTLSSTHNGKQYERSLSAPPLATTIQQGDYTISYSSNQTHVSKLKSSLRHVELTSATSQQRPSKSVKFNSLHLEKVCLFETNQSPSRVPNFNQIKSSSFKVEYSHWPPIQPTSLQHQQYVQLKRSLKIIPGEFYIHGQIVVRNLGYEKDVEIRYTLDGWKTVKSTYAIYLHGRSSLDIFAFDMDIKEGMVDHGCLRATIDMAVRYTVNIVTNDDRNHYNEEKTFWDNNDGHNYQIQIVETVDKRAPAISSQRNTSLSSTPISVDELKDADDNKYRLQSSSPCTGARYNFNRWLLKAKLSSMPPSPPLSPTRSSSDPLPPISNSLNLNNDIGLIPVDSRQTTPFACSDDNHPITISSYSDLVNK